MTFSKLTFEKPIPVSPLIALDRERCILCYRCTRFSSDVAEDDQLIARNRGAHTEIATFAEDPYRAPVLGQRDRALPGRRAHLDAVPLRGAAVGDPERADRLRRSARSAATSTPRCARARSSGSSRATTPRSTAAGSATRAASRTRTSAPRTGSREPLAARRSTGSSRSRWDAALDRAEELLRARRQPRVVTALSGSETHRASPTASARLLRGGLGAHSARAARVDLRRARCLPAPLVDDRRRRARRRSSATTRSSTARRSSISGSRRARRNGAEIVTIGAHGTVPAAPGAPRRRARRARGARQRARRSGCARPSGRCSSGRARAAAAARASPRLPHALGFDDKPGCAAFHLPATPNGRGVADGVGRAADEDEVEPRADRAPGRLRRRGSRRSRRPRARRARRRGDRDHDVPRPRGRLGRPRASRRRPRSSARARR